MKGFLISDITNRHNPSWRIRFIKTDIPLFKNISQKYFKKIRGFLKGLKINVNYEILHYKENLML